MKYGIIGYPLTHSFSPAYFRKKFAGMDIDATYDAFPLADISELPGLIEKQPTLVGLNVTIPYKEAVMPFLREMNEVAASIGAANCLAIKGGYIKGYNTDAEGFEKSLVPLLKAEHKRALVLGTGGSSKAVAYVLTQLRIPFTRVSTKEGPGLLTYGELTAEILAQHKLIINTTPVGMYPNTEAELPLPLESVGPQHLFYDLIYNPEETTFLAAGRQHGAVTKNGFEMLVLQAEASWAIWSRQGT